MEGIELNLVNVACLCLTSNLEGGFPFFPDAFLRFSVSARLSREPAAPALSASPET